MTQFTPGDRVIMNDPGSWVHRRIGTVERLNGVSPDDIHGVVVNVAGVGWTVVPTEQLELVEGGAK